MPRRPEAAAPPFRSRSSGPACAPPRGSGPARARRGRFRPSGGRGAGRGRPRCRPGARGQGLGRLGTAGGRRARPGPASAPRVPRPPGVTGPVPPGTLTASTRLPGQHGGGSAEPSWPGGFGRARRRVENRPGAAGAARGGAGSGRGRPSQGRAVPRPGRGRVPPLHRRRGAAGEPAAGWGRPRWFLWGRGGRGMGFLPSAFVPVTAPQLRAQR